MAQQFAQAYLDLQQQRWSRPEFLGRYQILAQTLLRALECGDITEEDFWLDDKAVISKISQSPDQQIQLNLHQLRQPLLFKIPTHPHNKFRYVDPEVMFGRATRKLSDIHHGFALQIASAKAADTQSYVNI
jgi:hypothetical protein